MSLITVDSAIAREKFLKESFPVRHELAAHPLFTLERLVELAQSLPRDRIEYNSGKIAVGVKPEDVPKIDMSPVEVIRHIETAGAWMVIKSVEMDPDYRALLEKFVEEANLAAGKSADDYHDLRGFIFVSSANSTTPFHMDMEENILVQIKGDKFVHTFDNRDRRLIDEEAMEITPAKHRIQKYEDWYEQRATRYVLKPGDGVHMPYTIPHWVATGESYSISMAMTWKTAEVARLNKIRLMNGTLRRFGLPQQPPGISPRWDALKVSLHDLAYKSLQPFRQSELGRKIVRGLLYGKKANYYLETQAKQ